jgi:pyrimidine operon attenuation protein / uracil phosphoribosyltransferase
MMQEGKLLLSAARLDLVITRLCHQLLEDWGDFSNACILGIQPRGVLLANRVHQRLQELLPDAKIAYGKLDITAYPNEVDFVVTGKKVLLVDDVLYTGRTISAALAALQHYGRPSSVQLLALVDRRFNRHLPVQANYVGIRVDALDEAYVRVRWQETHGADEVLLFDKK